MPHYRRAHIPGSTVFLPWVTHRRAPLFQHPTILPSLAVNIVKVMCGSGGFWEHTICTEEELAHYLDYVHYNPVKHGLVSCLHLWPHSSFRKWIIEGHYRSDWMCQCNGKRNDLGDFLRIVEYSGE